MSSETLEEKIILLNNLTGQTLSITHYTQWQISSYGNNSMFAYTGGVVGVVRAQGFEECVDRALQFVMGGMVND